MPRKTFHDESRELARRDAVIRALHKKHGPCVLGRTAKRDHFASLARAIVFQQLAGKAAESIHKRFVAALDDEVTAERVLATKEPVLRAAGLSGSKAASIRDLALKATDGTLEFRAMGRLKDDAIVERLVEVRGIGPWTAHMFLMFELHRKDVWPTGDYGVRKGYGLAWKLREMPTPKQLEALGESFRPYRSIAAWYCWRATEDPGW